MQTMPYIKLTTSTKITPANQGIMTEKFGKDIEALPGKSERWLMLCFEDNQRMALAGDDHDGTAMIEVSVYGKSNRESYDALTARLSQTVSETLDLPKSRIYVKYQECSVWGYNGDNF